MARKYRCPRPVNRLIPMRMKGLHGPFFQPTGSGCIHTAGNAYAPGGGLAGPKAIAGVVLDATSIQITFSQCVSISGVVGIEYQIDGGAWTQVTSAAKISDTVWDFTVTSPVIDPGDDVNWRYVGGNDTIVDCDEAEDIGDQQIPVQNPLVLAGNYMLLETGGTDIMLLEDDTDGSSGHQTEDAV